MSVSKLKMTMIKGDIFVTDRYYTTSFNPSLITVTTAVIVMISVVSGTEYPACYQVCVYNVYIQHVLKL